MCRPFQAKFVEGLLGMANIDNDNTKRKCLRQSEISKSEKRVLQLKSILTEYFINPFANDLEPSKLFNIASGSPVSEDISNCLLGLIDNGKKLYGTFNSRFATGESSKVNFWDRIKREDWKNFSSTRKRTIVHKSGKVIEIAAQRDILGFLLNKSQELKTPIDINEALKYPLSPVPLSIAHGDGERRKTNKSDLYGYAIRTTQAPILQINDTNKTRVYVLDLAAILRSLVKVPNTFAELVLKILEDIPKHYNLIYVACDTYRDISIKSSERTHRGTSQKIIIRSGQVRVPPDFQNFLCNGENKERLFCLIEETWSEKRHLLGNRIFYFARSQLCMKITSENTVLVEELRTNHEEADTKIAYLVQHSIQTNEQISEICVRSSSCDIDILVIMVGLFGSSSHYIIVDNGTGKNRIKIRIDRSTLSDKQQDALIGFHAFTGNDYVSSFLRKSKIMWTKVTEDDSMMNFCYNLGRSTLDKSFHDDAERFVCKMYNDKTISNVNSLRSKLYWKYNRKNRKIPDLSLLPFVRQHSKNILYVHTILLSSGSKLLFRFKPSTNLQTMGGYQMVQSTGSKRLTKKM